MDQLRPADVLAARDRVAAHVIATPAVRSPGICRLLGREASLKLENMQAGGSFKRRGVLNRLLGLGPDARARRHVAVSGGNFGIAVAQAGAELAIPVTIVLPRSAPAASAARMAAFGAEVVWTPTVEEAFARAEEIARAGALLLDDCDDLLISAGSGTLALEWLADDPGITDIVMSIGGGSMAAGVGTAARHLRPGIRLWGAETEGAASMHAALAAGEPVRIPVTSAVSTLGVPVVSRTFLAHAQALLGEVVVVPDDEAVAGAVALAENAGIWAEPAAGAALAAATRIAPRLPADAVVGILVCGGNAAVKDLAARAAG